MSRKVQIGDRVFEVPDNATMEQIQDYVASQGVKAPTQFGAPAMPQGAPPLPGRPTPAGALNGPPITPDQDAATMLMGNYPLMLQRLGGAVQPAGLPLNEEQQLGAGVRDLALGTQAVQAVPGLVKALAGQTPSALREAAKANFTKAEQANPTTLENMGAADDAAIRAAQLAGRGKVMGGPNQALGRRMPDLMRDFIKYRETNPDMTYEVGRAFASKAGDLSAAEKQTMDRVMKSQMTQLAKALDQSNRAAAVKAGVGDAYDMAMQQWKSAAQREAIVNALKKYGTGAAIGGGIVYEGKKILRDLSQ